FSVDHFETRLQDFVVEYEAGDLAKALQKVTEVTEVTDYVTEGVTGHAAELNGGTVARGVTSVTSVTGRIGHCEVCGSSLNVTPIVRLGESGERYFCQEHLKDYRGDL